MMSARTRRRRLAAAVVGVGIGAIAAGPPALAADRAYELVSPPRSAPRVLPGTGGSTPDGDVACFDAEDTVAGSQVNGILVGDGFCSWRTSSGWETKWVTGPAVANPVGTYGSAIFFVSPDGQRVVFGTDKGIDPDYPGGNIGDPDFSAGDVATQSAYMWQGTDRPRWLAPTPVPAREDISVTRLPIAASADLEHGVFQSSLQLVPEDRNNAIDAYEWTPSGIRLVSKDESGAAVGGEVPGGTFVDAPPGVISRDGTRIFFTSGSASLPDSVAPWPSVYMREGDTVRNVSPRRGGDTPGQVAFAGASDDGEVVYLVTSERLTPDPKQPGAALYRYELATDRLSLVATDPNGVILLDISADGSTAVYRTNNLVASELHIVRDGRDTNLGTLAITDAFVDGTVANSAAGKRALRITPDGSAVVFASAGSFAGTPAGRKQVYLWTPDEGVVRVSTNGDAAPPAADASIGNYSENLSLSPRAVGIVNSLTRWPLRGRVFADDGRIFFETAERLVPDDINEYIDVYEWHEGRVRLISPGTQRFDALYHDNSEDGSSVFFITGARLIPELDRDTGLDLYVARVGGGFPLPPTTPACEGDRCQGPLAPPTTLPSPGSSTFDGPGDVDDPAPRVARLQVQRITARQRRAFARAGRIVLRVRATERGIVTASGSARIGRRTVRVARSVVAVRSGATVNVRLNLSSRARRVLAAGRRLRVVIAVRYSESDTTIRRTVMLHG